MTSERRYGLRFPVLAAVVLALGVAVSVPAFVHYPLVPELSSPSAAAVLISLVVAVVLSEALTVLIPGSGAVSLSVPLFVAVAVYAGPSAAILAGIASTLPLFLSRPPLAPVKLAFNVGEVILTTAIPAIIYVELGAPLFARTGSILSPEAITPLVLAATLGTVVNLSLGGLAVSTLYGESMRQVWNSTFSWMLPPQLVLGFVGVAIAQIVKTVSVPGFALFVVPLLVARQTYQQSVALKQAYADTISSMVAALEAKDVYTKGHSLRVAEYSGLIARFMGVPSATVERIEYAALLHDLGKVGVSRRVLGKEASLTDSEYDEIKRHPDIGAHILSDVPYLADLVPLIAAHHERLDGSGYGKGLSGAEIPFEARLLSVADAYDAMTSARPYRPAMSHGNALSQLVRGSDTQFDAEIVQAFSRAWDERVSAAQAGGDLREP